MLWIIGLTLTVLGIGILVCAVIHGVGNLFESWAPPTTREKWASDGFRAHIKAIALTALGGGVTNIGLALIVVHFSIALHFALLQTQGL